jgi:hypothetical protein
MQSDRGCDHGLLCWQRNSFFVTGPSVWLEIFLSKYSGRQARPAKCARLVAAGGLDLT